MVDAVCLEQDPHRFIAVFEPGTVDLLEGPARRIGVIGGQTLTLGRSEPIALDLLAQTHRDAIPRRMAGA